MPDSAHETIRRLDYTPPPFLIGRAVAGAVMLAAVTGPADKIEPRYRLLIAQAMVENLTLVTVDPLLGAYGIPILRADT